METLGNAAKRKKRKTRKCLNEIRNRSLRNINSKTPKTEKISQLKYINAKPNICITKSRLTLALFPKMIKSETITRPLIPETENPSTLVRNNNDIRSVESVTSRSYKVLQPSNSECDSNDSLKIELQHTDSPYPVEHLAPSESLPPHPHQSIDSGKSSQDNTPGSLILFSSIDQTEDSEVLDLSPSGSTSSPLTRSSRDGSGYHLYEEFMNEIPLYLQQHSPALIKEDAMKKARSFLHNIYVEGCQKESENNILHCIDDTGNKEKFVPRMSAVKSAAHSPLLNYVPFTQASMRQSHSVANLQSLQDTPDYAYYPHKLNN